MRLDIDLYRELRAEGWAAIAAIFYARRAYRDQRNHEGE